MTNSRLTRIRVAAGWSIPRAHSGPPRKTLLIILVALSIEIAGLAFWGLLIAAGR
jgi:hypothetical protein